MFPVYHSHHVPEYNHNCGRNVEIESDFQESSKEEMVAVQDIKKDDDDCRSYASSDFLSRGKAERQKDLAYIFGGDCKCSKCAVE